MRAAVMETSFRCGLKDRRSLGLGEGLDGLRDGVGDFINDALGRVVGAVREVVPKAVDCVKIESWVRTIELVELDTA